MVDGPQDAASAIYLDARPPVQSKELSLWKLCGFMYLYWQLSLCVKRCGLVHLYWQLSLCLVRSLHHSQRNHRKLKQKRAHARALFSSARTSSVCHPRPVPNGGLSSLISKGASSLFRSGSADAPHLWWGDGIVAATDQL